ncbi:molecular chaperone DnaK, partial [Streptomyces sp. NPDC002889]
DVKSEVETALGELKEKLKGEDTAEIRTATEKVAAVSQKLGQALYANAAPEGAAAGAGDQAQSADNADDVVDAEIVDDEKDAKGGAA